MKLVNKAETSESIAFGKCYFYFLEKEIEENAGVKKF